MDEREPEGADFEPTPEERAGFAKDTRGPVVAEWNWRHRKYHQREQERKRDAGPLPPPAPY